ncbi:UNVERIFIED_CONTAM: hypothetical protein Slati_1579900 [Sesamum latifolium]|uniref:Uncharacterized protein n=1 Tax=Sesamum latifolium TaxID=2727402 RepID=A0AAW2X7X0_9LAMI
MELMARLVRTCRVESKVRRSGSARHAASYELRSAFDGFAACSLESELVGVEILRAGGSGGRGDGYCCFDYLC